ncbi:MAG: amino acid adenylation domain-containing protein [Gemmatimonadaceae bacterium]|nr:amino acid adenylation domain-containing protein [Gemmatimonadaceae bacterium]
MPTTHSAPHRMIDQADRDGVTPPTQRSAAPDDHINGTPAEGEALRRILDQWSGAGAVFAGGISLAVHFEQQAARTPDAIAVVCEGRSLTYDALNRRANQLAHHLRARGVVAETVVGLFIERGTDLLVGMLGIVKSGAAYLPLDLTYPRERTTFILRDARAPLVVTSTASAGLLDPDAAEQVRLDHDSYVIGTRPSNNPMPLAGAESLAYVIFTSGSTGTPKGCEVTHGAVLRLFAATAPWFALGPADAVAQFHSHAFDVSVFEIWGAWLHGARVVVVTQETARTPDLLLALLEREQVTILCQTPSAFKQLSVVATERRVPATLALRRIVLAGEALELQSLRAWMAVYGDETPHLVNMYGPTEATVYVSHKRLRQADVDARRGSLIGVPLPDTRFYILDALQRPVAPGEPGELHVGGACLARGYLRRDALTAERFVTWDGHAALGPQRLYRTGDIARWTTEGEVEYLGRMDQQVKIRGFRIELGEIEATLAGHGGVATCAVIAHRSPGREPRLVAYVVPSPGGATHAALRRHLMTSLPEYMVPSAFVTLAALPMNSNGKLDHRALPAPDRARPEIPTAYEAPVGAVETACCDVFAERLQLDRVGRHDNFFELGGDSLLAVQAVAALERTLARRVTPGALFTSASASALAWALEAEREAPVAPAVQSHDREGVSPHEPIAVVGMALRLPGADTVEAFWQNLVDGTDSVTRFTPEELDASVPASLRSDSAYVAARSILRDPAGFDPGFFGMSQRDAEMTDPQQRLLLELAWECLERAGYAPDRTMDEGQRVGVFAGVYSGDYARRHVFADAGLVARVGEFTATVATDKDYVASRIAHRLDLCGPAVSVHTACSTGLVAIVQAVDSLRAGHCTMALAGGAAITCPPRSGHLYVEGAMLSQDGTTRPFDAAATGTVFGDGGALVLLKRLSAAIADGDQVHAVISGAAVNNDGGRKASFTAPSIEGQASVIAAALADAGTDARSISYVEAHGTATPLGDPVEIEGLTRAFRRGAHGTSDTGFCRIGSVKSNIGHMVTAAGAVGAIKTALSLSHELLPATLHFHEPNPQIDFAGSPFVVNATPSRWPRTERPRRAGVSSFGVGGTNAHVIMEEAPRVEMPEPSTAPQLLRVSGRSPSALAESARQLAAHLVTHPSLDLSDVAATLRSGRTAFAHRLCVVATTGAEAAVALSRAVHPSRAEGTRPVTRPRIIACLPGGSPHVDLASTALYYAEPAVRDVFDTILATVPDVPEFNGILNGRRTRVRTAAGQALAVFALDVAVAALWQSRGLVFDALLGHSVGELAAAVIAGVMPLEEGARIAAARGRLLDADAATLAGKVSTSEVAAMQARLESALRAVPLAAPRIKISSTLTGAWLTDAEATDPAYWVLHLRETARNVGTAVVAAQAESDTLFLEVGPGSTLSSMVHEHLPADGPAFIGVSSLGDGGMPATEALALAVGRLWLAGIDADAPHLMQHRRVLLPTTPFERVRCWLGPADTGVTVARDVPRPHVVAPPPVPSEPTAPPRLPQWSLAVTDIERAIQCQLTMMQQQLAMLGVPDATHE